VLLVLSFLFCTILCAFCGYLGDTICFQRVALYISLTYSETEELVGIPVVEKDGEKVYLNYFLAKRLAVTFCISEIVVKSCSVNR
jgi:hypothetical protein